MKNYQTYHGFSWKLRENTDQKNSEDGHFSHSIYEGVKRTLYCRPNKKSLIAPHHLLSMYKLFKAINSELRDLSTLTIRTLAYADFVRFSEVSILKRDNIDIQDAYMRLFLGESKTDAFRSGYWIYISKLNSVLCPFKITQKSIQKAKNFEMKKWIYVPGRIKKNCGYRLRGINKPITYSSARQGVLNVLKKLRLSSKDYNDNTLRRKRKVDQKTWTLEIRSS